ncbi:MAG: AAA family ATPase [Rhodospirillales bacterium]|nr:AAA family ATPase [Rhodospirillales bacterium]
MSYKIAIEAFVLTPATRATLESVRADRRLNRSRIELHDGGLPGAVAYFHQNHTPNLIIVEEESDEAAMMAQLEQLAEVCDPTTKVIVIGQLNDIRFYRTLINAGISEYLVAPVAADALLAAIDAIYADPGSQQKGKVLAFIGARGGVGSSTVAHNVAWAIAQLGDDDVAVLDLDLAFGTAALAFNLDPKQTIADALANPDRLDATLIERFMVKHDDRLMVLGAPANLRAFPAIEPEAVERILELVRPMANFIVLDLPHQWASWVQTLLIEADEMIITAVPDLAGLREAKNFYDSLAEKRGEGAKPRLILNRVDPSKKTQLTAGDFKETIGVEPLQAIAADPVLFGNAANNGQMIGEVNKTHKIVEQFRQLAIALGGRVAPGARKKAAGLDGLIAQIGGLFAKKPSG